MKSKTFKFFLFLFISFCLFNLTNILVNPVVSDPVNHVKITDFDEQTKNNKTGSNSMFSWQTATGTDGLIRGTSPQFYLLYGNDGVTDTYTLTDDDEVVGFNFTDTHKGYYLHLYSYNNQDRDMLSTFTFKNSNGDIVVRLYRITENDVGDCEIGYYDSNTNQVTLDSGKGYMASNTHVVIEWTYSSNNEIRYRVYYLNDGISDSTWDLRKERTDIGVNSDLQNASDYEVDEMTLHCDGDDTFTVCWEKLAEIGYIEEDITGDGGAGILDSVVIRMNNQYGVYNQTVNRPCQLQIQGYGTGQVRFMVYVYAPDGSIIKEVDSIDDSVLTFFIPRNLGKHSLRIRDYYTENTFDTSYNFSVINYVNYTWYSGEFGNFFCEFYHLQDECYYNEGDEYFDVIYNFSGGGTYAPTDYRGYQVLLEKSDADFAGTWQGLDYLLFENTSVTSVKRFYITGYSYGVYNEYQLTQGAYRLKVFNLTKMTDENGTYYDYNICYISSIIYVCKEGLYYEDTRDATITDAIDNTFSDEQQFLLGISIMGFFIVLPIYISYKLSGSKFKTSNLSRQLTSIPPFVYIFFGSLGLAVNIYLELFELWVIVLMVFIVVGSIVWQLLGNSTYFVKGDK